MHRQTEEVPQHQKEGVGITRRYQTIPLWAEFAGGELDEVGEYKEPSPERKEEINRSLERLAEVFVGADFHWQLDGAINISLYREKFLRDHKDIDISVFSDDLAKLESLLREHKLGLFISRGIKKEEQVIEVGPIDASRLLNLLRVEDPNIMVIATDETGQINRDSEDPINYSDLHIHVLEQGRTEVYFPYTGVSLPKDLFTPTKKRLLSGKEINLSHPTVVAYHKLHARRAYDRTDLYKLRPHLRKQDFDILRDALPREREKIERKAMRVFGEMWASLPTASTDASLIAEKIFEHPEAAKHRTFRGIEEYVTNLAEFVAASHSLTFQEFADRAMHNLPALQQLEEGIEFLDELEKAPVDTK